MASFAVRRLCSLAQQCVRPPRIPPSFLSVPNTSTGLYELPTLPIARVVDLPSLVKPSVIILDPSIVERYVDLPNRMPIPPLPFGDGPESSTTNTMHCHKNSKMRRHKMNKHQRLKRYKKRRFSMLKRHQKRRSQREDEFRERLFVIMADALDFDAKKYVEKQLERARWRPDPATDPIERAKQHWTSHMTVDQLYEIPPSKFIDKNAGVVDDGQWKQVMDMRAKYAAQLNTLKRKKDRGTGEN